MDAKMIESIVQAVLEEMQAQPQPQPPQPQSPPQSPPPAALPLPAIAQQPPTAPTGFADNDLMHRMQSKTTARIGVGRAGARLRTQTLLHLRADHAAARDAVFQDVSTPLLDSLGLFTVQSCCQSRNQHLTRPDLGRQLSPEAVATLQARCTAAPDVQIIASDGLSSKAIEVNLPKLLPVLLDELKARGLKVGTPFFVQYGRVAIMEQAAKALDCGKVVCILVGERPGLGSAESMSAYLAYAPREGMPESERTVVSNIYSRGISAVEAGAYIAEVVGLMLEQRAGGVHLKK